mmetsp:Transcript_21971/g.39862  ORF Transcript_21971/g.39862 Transcript_21971/m.39862 type:complete len:333 (+) Transcript_21971:34-1032(+)
MGSICSRNGCAGGLVKTEARKSAKGDCRVLVTGGSGLLGREIVKVFNKNNWTVRGLAYSRVDGDLLVKCDLFDAAAVREQFASFRPNIVFHCAAERRPDKLEKNKEYALRINAETTCLVAELCKLHNAWFVYFSTNYVFDGQAKEYAEDATPNPLNIYGESKLAGERVVLETYPLAAIVRVPLLYGQIQWLGETSIDELVPKMRANPIMDLDNYSERYPTCTKDVALVMFDMATLWTKRGKDDASFAGIFHWSDYDMFTKFTMGKVLAGILRISDVGFKPTGPKPGAAPRPHYEKMLCSRLEKLLQLKKGDSRYHSDFKEQMTKFLSIYVST